MSEFKLLPTLVGHVVSEAVEAQPEATPSEKDGFEVVDTEVVKGPDDDSCVVNVFLDYIRNDQPDFEPVPVVVEVNLSFDIEPTDESFDHAFGTHHQMGVEVNDISVSSAEIPHDESNMDLLQLNPEQVQYITKKAIAFINAMSFDDWSTHVVNDDFANDVAEYKIARAQDDYEEAKAYSRGGYDDY